MGFEKLIFERDAFLQQAVGSLLHQIDAATLAAIVSGGESQFIAHAKKYWSGHGFQRKDYKQAFQMLRIRATQVMSGIQTEQ